MVLSACLRDARILSNMCCINTEVIHVWITLFVLLLVMLFTTAVRLSSNTVTRTVIDFHMYVGLWGRNYLRQNWRRKRETQTQQNKARLSCSLKNYESTLKRD
jgi:hypothetical protein